MTAMRFVKSYQRVRGQVVAHLADGITGQCRAREEWPATLADFARIDGDGLLPWTWRSDDPEGWEVIDGYAWQRHTCLRCWARFARLLQAGVPI